MGPSIRIDGDFLAGGLARLDDGRLQWGRRFASTETRGGPGPIGPRSGGFNGAVDSHRRRLSRRRPCAPRRWEASMGPSIRIDGDARGPRPYRAPQRRLQWGRRFASTETQLETVSGPPIQSLQWGRRFASTETCGKLTGNLCGYWLQWGRRFASTETRSSPV